MASLCLPLLSNRRDTNRIPGVRARDSDRKSTTRMHPTSAIESSIMGAEG